jgi:hypothetical protein
MSGQVVLVAAVVGVLWLGGSEIAKGAKAVAHSKFGHGVVHVVTLGKK